MRIAIGVDVTVVGGEPDMDPIGLCGAENRSFFAISPV